MAVSAEFIEETQQHWERRTGRPVSKDEARQIIANVAAFFDLLARWDRAAGNEPGAPQEERP